MMAMMLALLVAVAPPPAAANPPAEARTDAEVWALAEAADHPWAYRSYAQRFPVGEHAPEARRRFETGWGEELRRAGVIRSVARTPPELAIDQACVAGLLANEQSAEMNAYRAARDAPGVEGYKSFLTAFPQARCRGNAEWSLSDRMWSAAQAAPIPGFGPLAAKIERFAISSFDYPAAALRARQQGRVVAEAELSEIGRAENCRILVSAGPLLDNETCSFVVRRVRGEAARDAAGRPMRTTFRVPVNWQIGN